MRPAAVLAFVCLLAVAFAGCSGKDKGDGGASSTSTGAASSTSSSSSASRSSTSASGTTTSSSGGTTTASSNHPPSGTLSALVNGTRATFTLNGTDADGDTLGWNLKFGDGAQENGSALPTTVEHTYAAGDFAANLTISDGKASTSYHVTVKAVAGSPSQTNQVVDTGYPVSSPCTDPPSTWVFGTPAAGTAWAEWGIESATFGFPYKIDATSMSPIGTVFGLGFYDDGDALIGGGGTGTNTLSGTVPDGAVHALVMDCGGISDIAIHYEAGPSVVIA